MATYIEDPDNRLWLQASANPEQNNGGRYEEEWKGAYNKLKDLPMAFKLADDITDVHQKIRSAGFELQREFNIPFAGEYTETTGGSTTTKTAKWMFSSAYVEEIEAGKLGILHIVYEPDVYVGSSSTIDKNEPIIDNWSTTWQAYTVHPYAFCKQDQHADKLVTDPEPAPDTQASNRQHIKDYLAYTQNTNSATQTYGVYPPGGNIAGLVQLNKHEKAIADKVLQEKVALYHYPMLTRRQVWQFDEVPSRFPIDQIGKDVDIAKGFSEWGSAMDTLPSDLLITESDWMDTAGAVWKYLKTSDDTSYNVDKTTGQCTLTRTQVWQGVIDPDKNFYGDDYDPSDIKESRWVVGQM